jgi:hypothetical protein
VRRSGLWIIAGLLLSATGIVLFWVGLFAAKGLPLWDNSRKFWGAMTGLGPGLVIGGLILAAIAFAVHRKRRELEAGTGVIARWRVTARELEAFHRADVARDALFRSLRNRLRLPVEPPPEGLEIRIGTDAILAGDGCYGLSYFAAKGRLVDVALVDGQPAMLEFTTSRYGDGASWLVVFRLPVPEAARGEVQAVLDHFEKALNPARRERVRGVYATHYQAATGDPGKARTARARERRRTWRATGFACLVMGGLILVIVLNKTPGPYADPAKLRLFIIGGGATVAAGLAALALSFIGRR